MLEDGKKLQAYRFKGYWRDVGTLKSLHEANMDVALQRSDLDLYNTKEGRIYSEDTYSVPHYIGRDAKITRSIANQGAIILGSCDACVISNEAIIGEGAECTECVIMSGAFVSKNAKVHKAIIAPNTFIEEGAQINLGSDDVVLLNGKVGK